MHDPTYMRYLGYRHNSQRQNEEWCLPRTVRRGEWKLSFNEQRVSAQEDEKVLEMDGGDGCTTM